jgi:hypothetical protein
MTATHTNTPAGLLSSLGAGEGRENRDTETRSRPHYQEIADLEFAARLNAQRAPRKSLERAIRFTQAFLAAVVIVSALATLPKAFDKAAHSIAEFGQQVP